MNTPSAQILELISAYTIKEISESDLIILQKWINASSENKKIFTDYLYFYKKSRQISFVDYVDKNKAWNTIAAQLKTPSKIINLHQDQKFIGLRTSILKYVAAAVIVLIFFSTYYFLKNTQINTSSDAIEQQTVANDIQPGTHKAKLTLEDGTEVLLEKNTSYRRKNITSDAKGIVYAEKGSPEETVVYNYLTVPRGGEFHIRLSDGTEVWLNSETQIRYPTNFIAGETREVYLIYGEAYFDVSSRSGNNATAFNVIHKNQIINVTGTEFNVKAYSDEAVVYTTLVEGRVVVTHSDNKQILQPDQQYALNILDSTSTISKVNTFNEVSWREGIFSFENKTLKEIMTVLSRWYDMKVEFENSALEKEEFIGILYKNRSIERILKNIKTVGAIKNYEIHGKNVILR